MENKISGVQLSTPKNGQGQETGGLFESFFRPRDLSPTLTMLENTADRLLPLNARLLGTSSPPPFALDPGWASSDFCQEYWDQVAVNTGFDLGGGQPDCVPIHFMKAHAEHYEETNIPSPVQIQTIYPISLNVDEEGYDEGYDTMEGSESEVFNRSPEFESLELMEDHQISASVEEDMNDRDERESVFSSPTHPLYMEGRALLAGLGANDAGTVVPNEMPYNAVERDVIATLKDHWRPQKL
jgi:hypothetical protein